MTNDEGGRPVTSDHSIPRCLRCPDTALRRMAADPQLTEEERSAAERILARQDG